MGKVIIRIAFVVVNVRRLCTKANFIKLIINRAVINATNRNLLRDVRNAIDLLLIVIQLIKAKIIIFIVLFARSVAVLLMKMRNFMMIDLVFHVRDVVIDVLV